ncbi:3-phosphoglycerate dehydrogenase, partial [Enterobacter sp. CER55]
HLWQSVENVVISPHIGGVTAASYIKMGTVAAGNILAVTDATTVSP